MSQSVGVEIEPGGLRSGVTDLVPWSAVYAVQPAGHGVVMVFAETNGTRRVIKLRGAGALVTANRAWFEDQLTRVAATQRHEVTMRRLPSAGEPALWAVVTMVCVAWFGWHLVPNAPRAIELVLEQPTDDHVYLFSLLAVIGLGPISLCLLPLAFLLASARERIRGGRWRRLELRRTGVLAEGVLGEVAFFRWNDVLLRPFGVQIGDTEVPASLLDGGGMTLMLLGAMARSTNPGPSALSRWVLPTLGTVAAASMVWFQWPVAGPPAFGSAGVILLLSWCLVALGWWVSRVSKKGDSEAREIVGRLASATGWFDAEEVWQRDVEQRS